MQKKLEGNCSCARVLTSKLMAELRQSSSVFSGDMLFPPGISNPAYIYVMPIVYCNASSTMQQHFVDVCMSLAKLHDCELCRPEIETLIIIIIFLITTIMHTLVV